MSFQYHIGKEKRECAGCLVGRTWVDSAAPGLWTCCVCRAGPDSGAELPAKKLCERFCPTWLKSISKGDLDVTGCWGKLSMPRLEILQPHVKYTQDGTVQGDFNPLLQSRGCGYWYAYNFASGVLLFRGRQLSLGAFSGNFLEVIYFIPVVC